MATLQKIRNKAVLLAIIIGLALFAFIIGDFLNSSSSIFRQTKEKIATIGKAAINYKEYDARIQEMETVYKIQTGKTSIDEETSAQIRSTVFDNMVRELLLQQQSELLGLSVTSKELYSMINGSYVSPVIQQLPVFRNPETGQFDRTIMMNFLKVISSDDLSSYEPDVQEQIKQYKVYWLFWENNLKYSRLEEKINKLLSKAVQANSLDAESQFANRHNLVSFIYVQKPYIQLPDSLFKISGNDLKKRYNLTKERYYQDPYRSVKYVLVNVTPSETDFNAIETKMSGMENSFKTTEDPLAFANSNSDEPNQDCYMANSLFDPSIQSFLTEGSSFMAPTLSDGVLRMARILDKKTAPDSINVKQIVFPLTEEKRADSVLTVLRNGADFKKIASAFSGVQNMETGWFREIDAVSMGEAFLDACFSKPKNTYFLVKTKYDVRVIEVIDQTKPVLKTKLAVISLNIAPSTETYSAVYNKLNRLVAENQDITTFFEKAAKEGYEVQQEQYVHENDFAFAGIPQMRQAVRYVFNNDLNSISPILENGDNQFLVIGITKVSDGKYRSLEDVKQTILFELMNEQKADKIVADYDAKRIESLAQLSMAENLKIDSANLVSFSLNKISGIGTEPALIAAVMNAAPNKLAPPVKGKSAVYFYQVVGKNTTEETYNPTLEKLKWNSNMTSEINYLGFQAVKKASVIKDNRIRFY